MQRSDVVILDVRTPEEFSEGRIPKAVNLDVMCGAIDAACCELDPKLTYLVYCRSGKRSMMASNILANHGFANIYNLTDGITGWDGSIER